jgi:rRNA maturation endonuclease Nob1
MNDLTEYTEITFTACPNCGQEYDDADYDFQICHICGWDAERETTMPDAGGEGKP